MSRYLVLITLAILLFVSVAHAQFVTLGPKLAYTFGPNNGFTSGIEISVLPERSAVPYIHGYTFDLTFYSADRASFHVGAEHFFAPASSDYLLIYGIDVGPTVFFSSRADFGFSLIAFGGVLAYPYYEFAMPLSQHPPYHSIGSYLKIPVSPLNLHM